MFLTLLAIYLTASFVCTIFAICAFVLSGREEDAMQTRGLAKQLASMQQRYPRQLAATPRPAHG
jgi:hypothetical protein